MTGEKALWSAFTNKRKLSLKIALFHIVMIIYMPHLVNGFTSNASVAQGPVGSLVTTTLVTELVIKRVTAYLAYNT